MRENTMAVYSGLHDSEIVVSGDVRVVTIIDCPNVTRVVLPESVTTFKVTLCPELVSLELPDGLASLTISGCPQLPAVVLPAGLDHLVLAHCTALKLDSLPAGIWELVIRECPNVSLSGLPMLQDLDKLELSGVAAVPVLPADLRELTLQACTNLDSLQIPAGLDTLTIEQCPDITKVTVPNVEKVRLFKCASLRRLSINSASLVYFFIDDCPALTEIRLPAGLKQFLTLEGM